MPVARSCSPSDLAVVLNTTAGEYLVYRIAAEVADVEYSLVTEAGTVLADKTSCPSPCVRKWPVSPGETPGNGDEQHTLAMQFVSEGSLDYQVTKHAADDSILAEVKKCRFTLDGPPDDYFEALRVFVQ